MNTVAEFLKGLPLIVFFFIAGLPAIMAVLSAGGQRFLISTGSPAEINVESQMAYRGGLMGAIVFGALVLLLTALRFG